MHHHPALEKAHEMSGLLALHHAHLRRGAAKGVVLGLGEQRGRALLVLRRRGTEPEIEDVRLLVALHVRVLHDVRVAREELAIHRRVDGHVGEVLDPPDLDLARPVIDHRAARRLLLLEHVHHAADELRRTLGLSARGDAAARGGREIDRRHGVLPVKLLLPLFEARLEGGRLGALEDLSDTGPVGAALIRHVLLTLGERCLALFGISALAHPNEDLCVIVHNERVISLEHGLLQIARFYLRNRHRSGGVAHFQELARLG
mmetsp:Transcript_1011/g.2006  ORF Transcript_1011/g.2006 Transcript_1011/m.2006 type:complete len:260 (-) Transcript_1011:727-1506(-)